GRPCAVGSCSVPSRVAMPAPRACSAADERSKTVTSHPASRSTSAAVSPPTDPPVTTTRGIIAYALPSPACRLRPCRLRAAERGHPDHLELEQHPTLVHRRVA